MSESASSASIAAPAGGRLVGFPDLTIETAECSTVTNLQTQVAAFIASFSCQLKVLQLLKPLIEVIRALPKPPARALQEFSKAAADLAPLLLLSTPAGVLPFLRDLLCLEMKSLNCLDRNLQALTARGAPEPETRGVLDSFIPIAGIL